MDVFTDYVLSNFSMVALWFALLCALVSVLVRGRSLSASDEYETFLRYLLLLPGGIVSLYAFFVYGFYPTVIAEAMGRPPSVFQWEVASASFGFGILCLVAIGAGYGFRLATIVGFTLWLWMDSATYIAKVVDNGWSIAGDVGIWICLDIIIPALMILFFLAWRRTSKECCG